MLALLCCVAGALTIARADGNREPAQVRERTGLFDQSDADTLGLPALTGQHTLIYKATRDGYKFCHHSNLAVFRDRLYAMWSNGEVHEDSKGQRILGCSTADGVTWTEPEVIAADPDGPEGPMPTAKARFVLKRAFLYGFDVEEK
jgi:hypothetical protein